MMLFKHASLAGFTLVFFLLGCKSTPPAEKQDSAAPLTPAKMVREGEQRQQPAVEQYTSNRYLHIKMEPGELDGMKGVELWYTTDAGKNWVNHGLTEGRPEALRFLAPADGRYGFVKIPVDKDGVRPFTPRATTAPHMLVVVDTTPPVVEVRAPNGGELFSAGSMTLISWVAEDANMAVNPISVEVSSDDAQHWILLSRDEINDGSYYWDIPRTSSTSYRVRVTAVDRAGNRGTDESDAKFVVDGLPPEARITGPAVSNSAVTEIKYTARDVGGGRIAQIKLYTSRNNGASWEYYGNDDDGVPPFPFKALDGTYGLKLAAVDSLGNSTEIPAPGTPPQATLYLDSTPPQVELITFNEKDGVYAAGYPYDISWAARDNMKMPDNAISIYVSDNNGLAWREIGKDLENTGSHSWKPPMVAGKQYRLKIVAVDLLRNTTEKISPAFTVDTEIPEAMAVGPIKSSSNRIQIDYAVKNLGSSPLAQVVLWITHDGGRSWHRQGEDADLKPPFELSKNDGTYGITVTCATVLGLKTGRMQKEPAPGSVPQLYLAVDATPPRLKLLNFTQGGFYRGGDKRDVIWEIEEENNDPEGMTIMFSDDGGAKWSEIAARLDPRTKKYGWIMPEHGTKTAMVKLVARDAFGNLSAPVESERVFTIDMDSPRMKLVKTPSFSRYAKFIVGYEASDDTSGIQRIEFWGRRTTDKAAFQKLAEHTMASGDIELSVAGEGMWELVAISVDGAGFTNREIPPQGAADVTVVVDTTPPAVDIVKFKTDENKTVYLNARAELQWKASDNWTKPDDMLYRVELSGDGGSSWRVLAEDLKKTDKHDLKGMLLPGKKYRIRVAARDQAGHEGTSETADFSLDALAPKLTVSGIKEGTTLQAGSEVSVTWDGPKDLKDPVAEIESASGQKQTVPLKLEGAAVKIKIPAEEGKYQVRILAKDIGTGLNVVSNALSFEVILPQVKMTAPSEASPAGQELKIGWEVLKGKIVPADVQVEISSDRKTWEVVPSSADERQVVLKTPAKEGTYWLRLRWKEAGTGAMMASEPVEIRVVVPPLPPISVTLSLTSEPIHPNASMRVSWVGGPGRVELHRLAVEISTDQKTWTPVEAQITYATMHLMAPADTGKYFIRIKDKETGNAVSDAYSFEVRPRPTASLKLLNFTGGQVVAGGYSQAIFVEARGFPLNEVQVDLSDRSGAAESWQKVTALKPLNGKGFLWEIPKVTGKTYRLRLQWKAPDGTVIGDESRSDFTIDSTPPVFAVLGPPKATASPVRIQYEGKSAVTITMVSLYYSADGGATWSPGERVAFQSPLYFSPPVPGVYGIYLTGRVIGASADAEPPLSGSRPHLVLSYEGPQAEPLRITVSKVQKRIFKGGESLTVTWESSQKDMPKAVRLAFYSGGQKLEDIAVDLPGTGQFTWKVRAIDREQCEIRAILRKGDQESIDSTGVFDIDSSPPDWEFVKPKQ